MAEGDRFDTDIGPDPRAVTFLESKGLQRSYRWTSIWREQHAFAFTLAGVHRLDVLAAAQQLTAQAVAKGETLETFRTQFEARLKALGFEGPRTVTEFEEGPRQVNLSAPWRTRTIYDTNVRMAYAAAEWTAIEQSQGDFPAIEYAGVDDEVTRASHERWFGVVLPVGHVFWTWYFPPNDWFCRCYPIQISFAELESGAVKLTSPEDLAARGFNADPASWPTWTDSKTGRTASVPIGVGPGFAYNAGQARRAALADLVQRKFAGLSDGMAAAAAGDIHNLPLFREMVEDAVTLGIRRETAASTAAKTVGVPRAEQLRLADQARARVGEYPIEPSVIGAAPRVLADLNAGAKVVVVNPSAIGHPGRRHPTEPKDWARVQQLLNAGDVYRRESGELVMFGVFDDADGPRTWLLAIKPVNGAWRVSTLFPTSPARKAKISAGLQQVRPPVEHRLHVE